MFALKRVLMLVLSVRSLRVHMALCAPRQERGSELQGGFTDAAGSSALQCVLSSWECVFLICTRVSAWLGVLQCTPAPACVCVGGVHVCTLTCPCLCGV